MGFFSGYSGRGAVWGALAGLGRLTARGSNAASKDARRVVKAFVRGEPAQGACKGPKGARVCEITATGNELRVGDLTLARRPLTDSAHVSVCVPDRAQMVELKSGKKVEAQASKDVRAAAGALLREVGTGLGVRTDAAGVRRLVGAHGRRAAEMPGQCIVVKMNKSMANYAAAGREASQEAISTFTNPFPTSKQVAKVRKAQADAKRAQALMKARLARQAAKEAKANAAAEKKAAEQAKKDAAAQEAAQKAAEAAAKKAAADAKKAAKVAASLPAAAQARLTKAQKKAQKKAAKK